MSEIVKRTLVKEGDGSRLVFWAVASVVIGYVITVLTTGVWS